MFGLKYGQFSFLGPRPRHIHVRARFGPKSPKLEINIFTGHETRMQTISKPSEMSTDSTASFLTSSGTTHDHRAQTRPDSDHSPLVETTTESNAPSLLSGGSRTHSITTILPSASCGKPENTFLNSTTGFLVASSPLGMNCYRTSNPEYESPSARELGDSPGDCSRFFADLFWEDDSQMYAFLLLFSLDSWIIVADKI
jgi:hypothetical protein